VSALRSPTFPRAPEHDRVEAEQADDFVKFWRAGASAKGWFRCVECGVGVATAHRLPDCPSCRGWLWERAETSPFGLGPPAGTLEEDLPAGLGAVLLALALSAVLWLGLGGLAYGLFRLIQG
jgi:hypothetical protein